MMNFRAVKASIVNILGLAEAGRYRTIGYQRQGIAAETTVGVLRTVQVYYAEGEYPITSASASGDTIQNVTFNIDMYASAAAKVDLSVINDIGSTPEQRAAAIEALQESSALVDEYFDELVDIVYQTLMDARNYDFGMEKGIVSNRRIGSVRKDTPVPDGEYVALTGSMPLTCRIFEDVPGEIGVPGNTLDTTIVVEDDVDTKAGKTVINT
jgi:hypothetical protein